MAEFATLHDAIQDLVPDGATVAMEGFTHLIPFAAGHEMIRQGKRDLTLVRMTPDVIYDQMIGMGLARKLVFSWGGNPGVGSLHRFRDAVEHGYPGPLELEEHSHAGMAARYAAGASGLPFAVLRAYVGSDLVKHTEVASIHCPFTGEELAAVPALNPDVTVIHAQQADRQGNVGMWGITGVQREAVLSTRTSIVTVEEIVDELSHRGPNNVVFALVDSLSRGLRSPRLTSLIFHGLFHTRQRLLHRVGPDLTGPRRLCPLDRDVRAGNRRSRRVPSRDQRPTGGGGTRWLTYSVTT